MKNYPQDYYKNIHPLQSYYSNLPSDSKQNAQIKRYSFPLFRVRSSENLPLMPSMKQPCYDKKP